MSDLTHEDTGAALAPEEAQSITTVPHPESSPLGKLLLMMWNSVMAVSTAVLSFYVFVLKDDSATPFVVLGIIGLSLPFIVGVLRSRARSKQLRLELEQRMEEIRLERIKEAQQREQERLKRARILAANEQGIQDAIKNVDIEAYKVNNSMESSPGGL